MNLWCFSSKFPTHSWAGGSPLCIQTPSMIQWQKTPMNTFLDNLPYFWAAPPQSPSLNHPQVRMAATHWCCHSERVCAFTHSRALRTAERANSSSQNGPCAPSPSQSSSETHFSLSEFQQKTEEQIKTLKWLDLTLHILLLMWPGKIFQS